MRYCGAERGGSGGGVGSGPLRGVGMYAGGSSVCSKMLINIFSALGERF